MGDVAYDACFSVCNKRNTLRYSHRRITTSPFKAMYFHIFWQNYCRKTIEATTAKKVQNERKIDLRNIQFYCSFLVPVVFVL